ncbi:MAG: family 20 glycosylhydrolase, partial [Bacteroidia bacterium]
MKYFSPVVLIFIVLFALSTSKAQNLNVSVIPAPASIASTCTQPSCHFLFSEKVTVVYDDASSETSAKVFQSQMKLLFRVEVEIIPQSCYNQTDKVIFLKKLPNTRPTFLPPHVPETSYAAAYKLTVNAEKVEIQGQEIGLFYGLQTLLQLVQRQEKNYFFQNVVIADYPNFTWRGMHLDVCRHFFPVEFIKKYLDWMAFYKLNTFHWHLTEDQGWRIEIKKYPKLTEIGSKRKETIIAKNFKPYKGDGIEHSGFYTQAEIQEIVKYAADRQITVVPEIEMPGHALAALAAYPEYSCTGGPFEVATTWGVFDDVYCPKENTFQFIEDILSEVCALFPSTYIHIGGDECPKERWKHCKDAQAVMKRENLKNEEELQSYFIRRVEKILEARGKRLIGWDEILEGGLAPNATVMSWRGTKGGKAAILSGHDAVMSPGSHCYFDHYQGNEKTEPLAIGGFTPLKKVYEFQPDEALKEVQGQKNLGRILGAQANVWTEYMASSDHVEYMVFPRLLALSEVLWSQADKRKWWDFQQRLPHHLALLDEGGVNYRLPEPYGIQNDTVANSTYSVALKPFHSEAKTFYSINKSIEYLPYNEPFTVKLTEGKPAEIEAYSILPSGKKSANAHFTYYQSPPLPAKKVSTSAQGYVVKVLPKNVTSLVELDSLLHLHQGDYATYFTVEQVNQETKIKEFVNVEKDAILYEYGYLKVPSTGVYTFYFPRAGDFEVMIDGVRVG